MVKIGHPSIIGVEFDSRRVPGLPVEVLERPVLLARMPRERMARPERPTFHMLLLVRAGSGTHTVDFEVIEAGRGRLIWVRPGQVQSWDLDSSFDATLVLSRPIAPKVSPWFPGDTAACDLDPPSFELAEALTDGIRRQQRTYRGSEPERRLLVALFDALVALFDRAAGGDDASHLPVAYVAFRDAIEGDLGASHDVAAYATRLGYSSRTLSRACLQATGQTAKAVLAGRLLLEAQRLLVHTDLPVAAVGQQLGFSEAANFGKFFSRRAGTTPGRFRATYR